jgi:hypothetical protein
MIDVNAMFAAPTRPLNPWIGCGRQYRGTGLRNRESVEKLQISQHAYRLKVNKKAGASAGLF